MSDKKLYGVFDTVDQVWMGNTEGPVLHEDLGMAQILALVCDVRLKQAPGRSEAREWTPGPVRLRDSKDTVMGNEEALRKLESGEL